MIKTSATVTIQYDTAFSPFSAAGFEDSLRWLKASGFEAAEICISDPRRVDAAALSLQLQLRGLAVSTISTGQARALEGLNLTDPEPAVRARTAERIADHVKLASQIGCPAVTIGLLRGLGTPGRKEAELELLAEMMAGCAAFAAEYGIVLMLEPINRYETTLLNTVGETLALINQLGNPASLGVLYDVFHANIEEESIAGAIETLGSKLHHVHFADSNRWLPGQGHLDFAAVIASLRKIGFKGYVSLETLILPNRETFIKEAGLRLAQCLIRP